VRKADNLPPYCVVVRKSGSLNFLDPSGPVIVLVQFNGRLLISVVGSKIGYRFLITFSLFW
jgi:hypothetical protein